MKRNKYTPVVIAYNKEFDIYEGILLDSLNEDYTDCYTSVSIREGHNSLHKDILNNEYTIVSKTNNLTMIDRERIYALIDMMIKRYMTNKKDHIELEFIGF